MFVRIPLLLSIVLAAAPALADPEVLNPPGGPVYAEAEADVAPNSAPNGAPNGAPQGAPPGQRPGRGRMRQQIVERFDANGDGRLEPQERQRAKKAIRRMRMARMNRVIQRFDRDGDGSVGPGELPPRAANKLRKLDHNGDGWIDRRDFRGRRR